MIDEIKKILEVKYNFYDANALMFANALMLIYKNDALKTLTSWEKWQVLKFWNFQTFDYMHHFDEFKIKYIK